MGKPRVKPPSLPSPQPVPSPPSSPPPPPPSLVPSPVSVATRALFYEDKSPFPCKVPQRVKVKMLDREKRVILQQIPRAKAHASTSLLCPQGASWAKGSKTHRKFEPSLLRPTVSIAAWRLGRGSICRLCV